MATEQVSDFLLRRKKSKTFIPLLFSSPFIKQKFGNLTDASAIVSSNPSIFSFSQTFFFL
jgi:hypothetical protein